MSTRIHTRMQARDATEKHRASTPFELLYDLVFVVAVASLVTQFAHSVVVGSLASHVVPFLMVFFAIWWAWMSFTWFSSGYDNGDVVYRLLGVLQMAGVLVLAAGVPGAFESTDFLLITVGYVVMRVSQVALWVRVAIEHPATRQVSTRYAIGIAFVQVLWVLRLAWPPPEWGVASFLFLLVCELVVPMWANRTGKDPWHPGHIAERYGLFLIILLGEGVLAASNGVQAALAASGGDAALVVVGLTGLMILVGLWWLYFLEPAEEGLSAQRSAFLWGYGHVFLFAAVAAVGAGIEVAVEVTGHHTKVADAVAGSVVAIPVAFVMVMIWALAAPLSQRHEVRALVVLPAAIGIVLTPLTTPWIGLPGVVVAITLILAAVVAITTLTAERPAPRRTRIVSRRTES